MDLFQFKPRGPLIWGILIASLVLLGLLLLLTVYLYREPLWDILIRCWAELQGRPFLLYFLIVVVPAFPIPQSPLIVLGGMVYGSVFGVVPGAAIAASALALNIFWCYFLCTGPIRGVAQWFLHKFGYILPQLPPGDAMKFSILVRVTPFLPLCAQNYILGLLNIPISTYLLASWGVQIPIAFFIALTGGAILEGDWIIVVGAVCLLLIASFVLRHIRGRLGEDGNVVGM